MGRIPRMILLALMAVGAIAAVAAAIWLWRARGPVSLAAYDELTPLERALTRLANGPRGTPIIGGLVGAAVASAGLAVFVWRDRIWAHALAALGALAAIPAIWKIHSELSALEPAGFRARSMYVAAMTRVASGGTLFFAAVALAALGAAAVWQVARLRKQRAALVEKVVSVT